MSLVRPYNKKAVPNTLEAEYIAAWAVIEAEVERLQALGWKADLKGKADQALAYYKAANYNIYLFHYAININAYITRNNIDRTCISEEVWCKFKIDCVQENLPCISANLGGNYLKMWKGLAAALNIELVEKCALPDSIYGEWEYCAFETIAFTQTVGTQDIVCDALVPFCSPLKQITL